MIASIPDIIHDNLPHILKQPAKLWDGKGRAKDIFILSAIVAIGATMRNAYFHTGQKNHPNLNLIIAAPPLSYKSAMGDVMAYTTQVHRQYKDAWRQAEAEYQESVALGGAREARPFQHYFYSSGRNTIATLIQQLNSCPVNLMLETEASAIYKAFATEHGDYRSVLLKAFGHERVSAQAKSQDGGKLFEVEVPRLSVLTSTTPDQVAKILGDGKDGLASRFLVYFAEDNVPFENLFLQQHEADDKETRYEATTKWSGEILKLANWPDTHVRFTNRQSDEIVGLANDFDKQLSVLASGNGHLMRASAGRAIQVIARCCTVIACLSQLQRGHHQNVIYCDDTSFGVVMSLFSDVLIHHTARLYSSCLETSEALAPVSDGERMMQLFNELPDVFTPVQMARGASALGIRATSIESVSRVWLLKGVIHKDARGHYSKKKAGDYSKGKEGDFGGDDTWAEEV